jgi:DNA-binding transcriptional ArsR family regulator
MSTPASGQRGIRTPADIDQAIHAPARLIMMTYLFVVESADFLFLMRMTGLTWGNLSTHLSKLEEAGYVAIEKTYQGKKPLTVARMTEAGREAFRAYKKDMQRLLAELPE